MLKDKNYRKSTNFKCGEIYYDHSNGFEVHCDVCEIRIKYQEFLKHFNKVHLPHMTSELLEGKEFKELAAIFKAEFDSKEHSRTTNDESDIVTKDTNLEGSETPIDAKLYCKARVLDTKVENTGTIVTEIQQNNEIEDCLSLHTKPLHNILKTTVQDSTPLSAFKTIETLKHSSAVNVSQMSYEGALTTNSKCSSKSEVDFVNTQSPINIAGMELSEVLFVEPEEAEAKIVEEAITEFLKQCSKDVLNMDETKINEEVMNADMLQVENEEQQVQEIKLDDQLAKQVYRREAQKDILASVSPHQHNYTSEDSSLTGLMNTSQQESEEPTNTTKYKCDHCQQHFTNERRLQSHRFRLHLGIICDICGMSFTHMGNMRRHRIRHTGIKSQKCSICDASFYTGKELNSHMLRHTGARGAICEICGKLCRDRGVLTAHMRRHTGERPAECHLCGKRFFGGYDLGVHLTRHSKERPCKCEICGAAFQHKRGLRSHMKRHAEERRYTCRICESTFKQAAGLKAHMYRHERGFKRKNAHEKAVEIAEREDAIFATITVEGFNDWRLDLPIQV